MTAALYMVLPLIATGQVDTELSSKCWEAVAVSGPQYPRCVTLIENNYWMTWNINRREGWIDIVLARGGEGWMGIGIGSGSNGGMIGLDQQVVYFGGTNSSWQNNSVMAADMFSTAYWEPEKDAQQDVSLLADSLQDGYMRATIRRTLISCDAADNAIRRNFEHMVAYAMGWGRQFLTHGPGNRGNILINFDSEEVVVRDGKIPGTSEFTLKHANYHIPTADRPTFSGAYQEGTNQYKCYAIPVQEVTHLKAPFDVLKYEPIITSPYIHHFLTYQCDGDPRPNTTLPWGSDRENDIYNCAMGGGNGVDCGALGGWAAGGNGLTLPEGVGLRITQKVTWFLLEAHFYNPLLNERALDSSGFSYQVTSDLRPEKMGELWIGVDFTMKLEPGKKDSPFSYHCPSSAVEFAFPPGLDEVEILEITGHLHQRGRKTRVFAIRDGKRIPILIQNHYDYNYQGATKVPAKIKRGDALEIYCGFDTEDKSDWTGWGERTQDEMCIAVMMFYPSVENKLQCIGYNVRDHHTGEYKHWSLMWSDGIQKQVRDRGLEDPYSAMLSGCSKPAAKCSADLWNSLCMHVPYCYLPEICTLEKCMPISEHPTLKNTCPAVEELCRPCYSQGEGQCTDCVDVCEGHLAGGWLTPLHEKSSPRPLTDPLPGQPWYNATYDLPWGEAWSEDLTPHCRTTCRNCHEPLVILPEPVPAADGGGGGGVGIVVILVIVGASVIVLVGGAACIMVKRKKVPKLRRRSTIARIDSTECHTVKVDPKVAYTPSSGVPSQPEAEVANQPEVVKPEVVKPEVVTPEVPNPEAVASERSS